MINRNYEQYLYDVDSARGAQKNGVYFIYSLTTEEIDLLDKAIESKPVINEVDKEMKVVSGAVRQLTEVVNEAKNYYYRENYKDDDFAKAKELHPSIMGLFQDYYKAYYAMREAFIKLQYKMLDADLNELKKDEQPIRYHVLMNLDQGRKIIRFIQETPDIGALNLSELDLMFNAFKAGLSDLEESIEQQDEAKEFGNSSIFLEGYTNLAGKFIISFRNLKQRVKKKDFNYTPTYPNVPDRGTPEKMIETYQEMFWAYNQLVRTYY
ncbi:DUF3829 domain-containing protein [Sinomicrobium sp. FJxs]|uniref:DUF3829 domain-containing protein n=1 Tax=Sinomicrobium weinanense TaxID=2842200 RepID=A0A926Q0U0_9FLAO|nr:DUF3829 domain-containing protein [Sinomicrobium weinanense]MBU3122009.1 YiiG family protein [Sinomicrobium weinanense]